MATSAERRRRFLLSCGILAPVLYVAMTLLVGLLWEGYSVVSGVPSELAAIGAPTRPLWIWLGAIYAVLMVAFGWTVWKSAPPNHALRVVGALLMAHTVFGQFWPPMHQRAVLAAGGGTLTDTLHLVWAAITVVLFLLIVGFGAAALGGRFRIYSTATIVIVFACGAVTATYASRLEADLPTPGVGVWERISIAAFMTWIVVLAVTLLRTPRELNGSTRPLEVSMNVLTRKWWSRIALGLLGTILAIQLVPYGRNHTNPPITGEPAWDAPETRALAKHACFDCHSNETAWPVYASIAPASWLVQRDVDEGRAVLNFSEWTRPQEEAEDASEEVLEGEMPPAAYTLIHAHARLDAADRVRLARGLARTLGVALKREARERHRR